MKHHQSTAKGIYLPGLGQPRPFQTGMWGYWRNDEEGSATSRGVPQQGGEQTCGGAEAANSTARLAPDRLCMATDLPRVLDFSWPLSETPSPHL